MPTLAEVLTILMFLMGMIVVILIGGFLLIILLIMFGPGLQSRRFFNKFFNEMKERKRAMIFSELEKEVNKGTFIEYIHFTTSHYTIWWTPDDLFSIYPTLQEIALKQSYLNEGETEFNFIFDNYLHLENGTAVFIKNDSLPDDFFEKHKSNILSLHHRSDKLRWPKELLESRECKMSG